ncbi:MULTISPECIES: methyltransferase type 12 [Stenotrophomonas]|uniref:class I SAM-dependent methyltransferase n=1 Tax=Stenotrophomonas TaxID=40323 RepID=UPI00077065B3|nr:MULTISPECIES: methyltransferase type 12 [Stenotrophomonas]AMJ58059.1 methyltransferase type 12 [Stenotrophomonas sp. KCTC 12332]
MPGFKTRNVKVTIGGDSYLLRVLSDKQQLSDLEGHGKRLHISSAQWGLFGQLWPSGQLLAQAMCRFDIEGKRILQFSCGIGLASIVLMRRGVEVIACDEHPLAEPFLAHNAALNGLPPVRFHQLRHGQELSALGTFDLFIASDVLQDRSQAEVMANVVLRHAKPSAEVVIIDPGLSSSEEFSRMLGKQRFALKSTRCRMHDADPEPYRGQLLHYSRNMSCAAT